MFERTKQGAVDVIRGGDPLNVEHVQQVTDLLNACVAHGQPRVVFNLESVPLIDSAGLELLLDFRDLYRQRGGSLKLAAPNQLCREILKITEVSAQLDVFHDTVTAVGSFAQ